MTTQQLQEIVAKHGLTIDSFHGGAGKFRDVYIGIGAPYETLKAVAAEIKTVFPNEVFVTRVTNEQHEDFGKPMVEIKSFWWDAD